MANQVVSYKLIQPRTNITMLFGEPRARVTAMVITPRGEHIARMGNTNEQIAELDAIVEAEGCATIAQWVERENAEACAFWETAETE